MPFSHLHRKRFRGIPFRLRVGLEDMYYVPHGEPVQAMFRNGRDLDMKPIFVVAMRDQFGMQPRDFAIYERDGSGANAKPLDGWEHMDPSQRVFYNQHRDVHNLLNGTALDGMTARFVANLTARLRTTPLVGDSSEEWTELPDLFAFLRGEMLHAACTSLVGEHLFELCPDFCRDFWEFDANVMTYLRRTPRWLAPRAYAVRDRLLAAIRKWREHAEARLALDDPSLAGVEYEPVWGARLMRARAETYDRAGLSAAGRASMDLGLLWATNANVIPATGWALLNVLASPGLTERVLAETAGCFDGEKDTLDVSALCSKPLLTSIYLESLRFSVATTVARNPVVDDFRLCGWTVPRDAALFTISWFGGRDPNFWNTGRILPDGTPEHPVDAFWAERFLEYPDDPASGPVRKPDEAIYRTAAAAAEAEKEGGRQRQRERTAEDDRAAKVVSHTAALQGHLYPYGGGNRICPGRHFAKQEMMATVAVMLHEFEIELADPGSARKARPDMAVFPAGTLGPDRKVPVRLRRRRHG